MRIRLAIVACACAFATLAGVATALAGAPGAEPGNPIPASCDLAEIHPTSCLVLVASCSAAGQGPVDCATIRVSGPRSSTVRILVLRLARRYVAVSLLCRASAVDRVNCRSLSRTSTNAVGTRVAALRLPASFSALRISCRTSVAGGFACKLGK
jgi:hypothetical protein